MTPSPRLLNQFHNSQRQQTAFANSAAPASAITTDGTHEKAQQQGAAIALAVAAAAARIEEITVFTKQLPSSLTCCPWPSVWAAMVLGTGPREHSRTRCRHAMAPHACAQQQLAAPLTQH